MGKTEKFSIKPKLILVLIAIVVFLSGCNAAGNMKTSTIDLTQSNAPVQSDQFNIVSEDGVEVACPKHWQTYSTDPSLVYGVSRADTIRIVIGVLPAADRSYYDSLVTRGTVNRTVIAGYPAYKNDYTYNWNGHQVTNICVTVVNGDKACHFMFLCDTSAIAAYAPIFEYVLNSLKFD